MDRFMVMHFPLKFCFIEPDCLGLFSKEFENPFLDSLNVENQNVHFMTPYLPWNVIKLSMDGFMVANFPLKKL